MEAKTPKVSHLWTQISYNLDSQNNEISFIQQIFGDSYALPTYTGKDEQKSLSSGSLYPTGKSWISCFSLKEIYSMPKSVKNQEERQIEKEV